MVLLSHIGHCEDKYRTNLVKRILILSYPNIQGSRHILAYYRIHGLPTFVLNNGYLSLFQEAFPEADLASQVRTARAFCIQAQLIKIAPGLALTLSWNAHKGQKYNYLLLYVPPSSVTAGTLHLSRTEILSPQTRGWTCAYHSSQRSERCIPKPLLHSVLSKQPYTAAPYNENQDTQTYQPSKPKGEKTGNVKCVGVLKCSYSVKFPSTKRAQPIPFLTCFFNQSQT